MDSSIEALLACRLITYTEKARVPKTLAIFIRNATHALTHEGRVDLGQNIRGDIFHHSASSTLFYAFSWFNPRNPFEYLSLGLDIVCQMTLHPSKGCSAFHLSKAEAFLAHPAFLKPFDTHRPSLQRVVLCGFSMGGGIATIMAMLLAERNTYPLTLVTFGTSRMGDAAFSSRLKEVCEPESQNIVLCRRRRAGRERERERERDREERPREREGGRYVPPSRRSRDDERRPDDRRFRDDEEDDRGPRRMDRGREDDREWRRDDRDDRRDDRRDRERDRDRGGRDREPDRRRDYDRDRDPIEREAFKARGRDHRGGRDDRGDQDWSFIRSQEHDRELEEDRKRQDDRRRASKDRGGRPPRDRLDHQHTNGHDDRDDDGPTPSRRGGRSDGPVDGDSPQDNHVKPDGPVANHVGDESPAVDGDVDEDGFQTVSSRRRNPSRK
mmetsp:Transcript_27530/g.79200  ORF Transcript_27530/g.79200 Transcript_27530/m.79200 type:complete len:440 (-) Transcript_27530:339-1658(-)